jgi:hypothetical protein
VQVFFPAIESHDNTVVTTILSEPGMKRLMDVSDEVSDEPQWMRFSLRGASGDSEPAHTRRLLQ